MNDVVTNATKESTRRYQLLFENMLNGFAYCKMIFDQEGNPEDFVYLEVNRAFGELTGLKDVVGKKVTEVIPDIKTTNPELFTVYGRVSRTQTPEQLEVYVKPLSIYFSISVYSPEKEHFVAVFDNITERKRAVEQLMRNEERLELAMKAAKIGIWDLDLLTNNLYYSPQAATISGVSSQTETFDSFLSIIHPDEKDRLVKTITQSISEGKEYEGEYRLIRPDGKTIWISLYAKIFEDTEKGTKRMIGTVQDITQRKETIEELKTRKEELEKFEELTIGRELQMVDLKNKINKLAENKP